MSTAIDSKALLERVRTDAQAGIGVLDAALRAAVFSHVSARAVGQVSSAEVLAELPADVRAFAEAVLERPLTADVDALKSNGRSDDFIYELSVVAAVAAGSARGRAGFALLRKEGGSA